MFVVQTTCVGSVAYRCNQETKIEQCSFETAKPAMLWCVVAVHELVRDEC
jgi:hypothetical protein